MKPFLISVFKFELWFKMSWLVSYRCHGHYIKNLASWCSPLFYHPANFECTARKFELPLFPCLTNQWSSLVPMATGLKRQPFSESARHASCRYYHSCGSAFGKVLKYDVEVWAVDDCPPPSLTLKHPLMHTGVGSYGPSLRKPLSKWHFRIKTA